MIVNRNSVEFHPYEVLQKMLDLLVGGYTIEEYPYVDGEPERFAIQLSSSEVATATYDAATGDFHFEIDEKNTASKYLESRLVQLYSGDFHWIVLYSWHGAWAHSGQPKPTADLAVADIEDIAFMSEHQPQLVAFHPHAWPTQMLQVEHCWLVHGHDKATCRMGFKDGGDQMFILTVQE